MPWIYGQQMTLGRKGESHLIPLITVPVRLSEGQKLISCLAFPASAHCKAHPLDCLGFTSAKDCEPPPLRLLPPRGQWINVLLQRLCLL